MCFWRRRIIHGMYARASYSLVSGTRFCREEYEKSNNNTVRTWGELTKRADPSNTTRGDLTQIVDPSRDFAMKPHTIPCSVTILTCSVTIVIRTCSVTIRKLSRLDDDIVV